MNRQADANVFTIPAGADFAAALAQGLLDRIGDPLNFAEATIFLPTRRAASGLAESFAHLAGGAALLPDLRPLGDLDDDGLDAPEDDLPGKPAIAAHRRHVLLATMIRRWALNRNDAMGFAAAHRLAQSLAGVLDECIRAGASLERLDDLAPEALAGHWAEVKDFLAQMRDLWPTLLEAEGCIDPPTRINEALAALGRRLAAAPPPGWTIAAGSTGSLPAVADAMKIIATLPQGAVILHGLDRDLDAASWEGLDPGHPQYGLKRLLERLEVTRDAVKDWVADAAASEVNIASAAKRARDCDCGPAVVGRPRGGGERSEHAASEVNIASAAKRARLLRETLRPAPTTDAWRALAGDGFGDLADGLEGLALIEAASPSEEAAIVALILRQALETPGRTAALVTRDRTLARRTAAALGRWNIAIDDSAGRPLAHTKAGSFLCLLAEAAAQDFAPVPLLALLKHPLAARDDAAAFRKTARRLDLGLRGPRPDAGLAGIATHIAKDQALAAWFDTVRSILAPFAATLTQAEAELSDLIACHIAAAEALAPELWSGADGAAANALIAGLIAASDGIAMDARGYAPLFAALAMGEAVRPPYRSHPRLAILGPLEARLQHFDVTVLGGLNEGIWPPAAPEDPWFSRPMRSTLGLEQPERAIGRAAHDFANLAAGPHVFLTRALKADGTPTVASRWLQRLEQLTKGLGLHDRLKPDVDYRAIAAALDAPERYAPVKPPAPCPPVAVRPRRLTFTEVETWVRDPYAIYAKHVLRLRKLDPLDAEIGPLERGTILHAALERFVRAFPHEMPADATAQLAAIAEALFAAEGTPQAVLALWRPRFIRAARWFVGAERGRREGIAESFVEVEGKTAFPGPFGAFLLAGRADRIDRLLGGGGAIVDYKTGSLPRKEWLVKHLSPQLALEGAMLQAGGFESIGKMEPRELLYVRITGGADPGEIRAVPGEPAKMAAEVRDRLIARIALFDDPSTPYHAKVAPKFARDVGDYDHLARIAEWSAAGDAEDET